MIRFEQASVHYGGETPALSEVSVELERGRTTCLVGASGSGKSTLMRLVNRLVDATEGRVLIGGRDVRELDPVELRRGIGYCVQGGGLFPHLSIAENVAMVPRLLGWDKDRSAEAVERTMGLVRLDPARYASRRPGSLSGGERQRAAIARALAADPEVVLLDEPLGALDPHLRETVEDELRDLFKRLEKTVLFVTHDMHTAVRLGHRLAVMGEGRLLQFAPPREVVASPASPRVAALLGRRRAELERWIPEDA